jgi:hypothetical protein
MTATTVGVVYGIPPQPPVEEHTRRFDAGAVSFGVEYRALDPEGLEATYRDRPEYLEELRARSPEGGFFDEGVTIHVFDASDGHEYLRFDVFDDEPHYHYIHRTVDEVVVNNVVDFDPVAGGDMLVWAVDRLRTRLGDMLEQAGGGELAKRFDHAAVDRVLDDVHTHAAAARGQRAGA